MYKKCNLASLFSLAPHSLIEGGIFFLGYKLLQWVVVLFVWSFLILYERLSISKISLQQFDILVCIYAKCGNLIGWAACMFITDLKLIIIIIVKSANICTHCIYRKSFRSAYSQLGMLGAFSCTNCNSNWANKIHQLTLEWWIQKSLQWTSTGRTFSHMFNTSTHWWWPNQSAASSIHSKTTSYKRDDASYSDLFQLTYCHYEHCIFDNIIGKFDLKTVSLGWRSYSERKL